MKISRLIHNEEKWTKGCLGRDKHGNPINSFNVLHYDGKEVDLGKDAVSFSLYGAVIRLYSSEGQAEIFLKLGNIIREFCGRPVWLATWNDEPERTFKEIQEVLEIANL